MSFTLKLSSDQLDVEPGVSVPLGVEVHATGDAKDRFELEVEGLDPEWVAVPVPSFMLSPGETRTEKLFFKPPRESESVAGAYPFLVRVRSLESGESRTDQGVLRILPYHHLSMELHPKRGTYSPTAKQNVFQATIVNLGNSAHTIRLFASDPEDACTFSFAEDQVIIPPGSQKEINVEATPNSRRLFSASRLFGFGVTARSIEHPAVNAAAQGQLEHRPLLTPGNLFAFILLAIIVGGWIALIPKPPSLELFVVDKTSVYRGDDLTIRWRAANAKMVRVALNGKHLFSSPEVVGSFTLEDLEESGVLTAIAARDSKQSQPSNLGFSVVERPVGPIPIVAAFEITPKTVQTGQSFLIRYRTVNAQRVFLQPLGKELVPPDSGELQLTATEVGTLSYTLVAQNGDKTTKSGAIKVTVTDAVDVSVVVFRAEPATVDSTVGQVKLVYQLAKAVRAELAYDGQVAKLEGTDGEITLSVTKTTDYTLTGYDEKGQTVSKTIKVEVKEPSPTTDTTSPPATTGGGEGGVTTGGR